MLEKLEQRIKDYTAALEKSVSNHNTMLGAFNELKYIYDLFKESTPAVETIAGIVDPAQAPVIDAAINTTESVVNNVVE